MDAMGQLAPGACRQLYAAGKAGAATAVVQTGTCVLTAQAKRALVNM